MAMVTAVIGLGSNVGDRMAMLSAAAGLLSHVGEEVARSSIYETSPVGPPQGDYLNAVLLLKTNREPEGVLDAILAIETTLGRVRRERWGPRTIDLDLLTFGERRLQSTRLTLPHPEIAHRAFVLRPWAEIAPEQIIPGLGTVAELLGRLPESELRGIRLFAREW